MNAKSKIALFGLVLGASLAAAPVMAQTAPQTDVQGHPRVNEVNNRLDNQQNRIDKGVANGTMTQKQAARDETHDANIARRESVDEARHNGHLTKREQNNLNRSENRNSGKIYKQKH
ncbi:hypothetical protein KPL74_09280 [Bacillus sp. NP157]|nr:hypothetical protein KPL74_09280 [Bacillus sp. NP157]